MADVESHRSISINVAKERLQIRTDLSDADLKEIVDYIDERYASYGKYNLEAGKRMALLALEMAQQLFEAKRRLHQAKVYKEQMDQSIKDISSMLDEGITPNRLIIVGACALAVIIGVLAEQYSAKIGSWMERRKSGAEAKPQPLKATCGQATPTTWSSAAPPPHATLHT